MSAVIRIQARPNISVELANILRDMIFDGDLAAGERINEVHLASRLGVSRTPLREALSMLCTESALESIPRRGFFVRPLSLREFEQIYPIRPLLDPEALRLSGIPSKEGIASLERLDHQLRTEKDRKKRISLDDKWHLELIANCRNQVLIKLIKQFMGRFRRYGLVFSGEQKIVETSTTEHREIIKALKQGKLDSACEWLHRNLSSDKQSIVEWLAQRDQ